MLQGTGWPKFPFKDTSSHLAHLSTFSSIPLPSSFYGILLYFTKIITRPQCEYQHDEPQAPQRAPHQHRTDPPPPRPRYCRCVIFPPTVPLLTTPPLSRLTTRQHDYTPEDRLVYGRKLHKTRGHVSIDIAVDGGVGGGCCGWWWCGVR